MTGYANATNNSITTATTELTSIDDKTPALGTNVMAGSTPVTIATDDTLINLVKTAVDLTTTAVNTNKTAVDAVKTAVDAAEVSIDLTTTAVQANTVAVENVVVAVQIMDDWDNGASDGASVSGDVAHDFVDAGEPVKIGGKASTSQPTAVANSDRVDAYFDEYGRLHVRDIVYDTSSGANKAYVTNSINFDYVNGFIDLDSTNVSGTNYYPSSTGISLDGQRSFSFTGKIIEADALDNIVSVEVTNDEDQTNADWVQIYFFDNFSNTWVNNYTANAATVLMAASLDSLNFRFLRVKFQGQASNTIIIKGRCVPL